MRPTLIALVSVLVLAPPLLPACGSSSPALSTPAAASEPAPAAPPADDPASASPGVATCEDACTEYAVCSEEIHGGEFHGGGACVSDCEERSPEEQAAYFACISAADGCTATLGC